MRSARSGTVSVTTGSAGGSGALCKVGYAVNAWTGGFTANLTVTNTGNTAWNAWTLAFAFPGDQKVTNAWNAQVARSGANVSAVNLSYNGSIPAGGPASFGFQGTWSASDATPGSFTVNGTACTTS